MSNNQDNNFNHLITDLLCSFRAGRSYQKIDTLLSLGVNQYYRWETGLVKIKWTDFVLVCSKLEIPLKDFLIQSIGYSEDPSDYSQLIKKCIGSFDSKQISRKLNVSRFVMHRWLNNITSPNLYNIFLIFHHLGILSDLIEKVVPSPDLKNMKAILEKVPGIVSLSEKYPWCVSILCAISLEQYQALEVHTDDFISETIKMPLKMVAETLSELAFQKILIFENNKYKINKKYNFRPSTHKISLNLLLYWMKKNMNSLQKFNCDNSPLNESLNRGSLIVCNMSFEKADEAKKLYKDFINKMTNLLSDDKGIQTEMYSMVFTMVNFKDHK